MIKTTISEDDRGIRTGITYDMSEQIAIDRVRSACFRAILRALAPLIGEIDAELTSADPVIQADGRQHIGELELALNQFGLKFQSLNAAAFTDFITGLDVESLDKK